MADPYLSHIDRINGPGNPAAIPGQGIVHTTDEDDMNPEQFERLMVFLTDTLVPVKEAAARQMAWMDAAEAERDRQAKEAETAGKVAAKAESDRLAAETRDPAAETKSTLAETKKS